MFRIKPLLVVSSWAVWLLGLSLAAASCLEAQALEAQALDESSDASVEVRVTARLDVAMLGEPLRSTSASSVTLSSRESGQLRIGARNCLPFSGGYGKAGAGGVVWHLSVALEAVDWDRFMLSYHWSREDVESGAVHQGATSERGLISLRHDETAPIDLARIRRPGAQSCDLYVQLGADYAGPGEFQNQAALHEVWLTHKDSNGEETSTRLDLAGVQGEALGFLFDPLKLELPSADRSKEAMVAVRLHGHVRTWMTARDRLLVIVETRASLRSSVGTGYSGSSSSGAGTKRFHIRPGEAVKIIIPPVQGGLQLPGADPENPLPAGFERRGETIVVDSSKAFAGHELALVIQTSVRD